MFRGTMTDFHRILYKGETLNFEQFNNEHRHCMDFLREACSSAKAPHRVIVTHHVPSFVLSSPDFKSSRRALPLFVVPIEDGFFNVSSL